MSYYQFNRQEILQKAKGRYSKEKATEFYLKNEEAIKEKSKNWYKNLSKEEKDKIKEYQRERYQNWQYQNWQKRIEKSKRPINLDLANVDQIAISNKFKHNDDGFKYFIGYKEDDIVKPLCIILPQMSGYINYFANRGKNIYFVIKDDDMLHKYNEIWNKIKKTLNIKSHSTPVYDEKNT